MSRLASLAYVSSASGLLPEADLEELLRNARAQNLRAQITGVLLYHDGSFFQYLEGPETELDAAYERIVASRQHHGVIRLFHRPTDTRHFDDWQMGFAHAPKSLMLQLAQASWVHALSQDIGTDPKSSGIKVLLEFWRNATRSK
jgi:Sensors of blue-light using FAD